MKFYDGDQAEPSWNLNTDTPIFQLLNINTHSSEVTVVPFNAFVEKEKSTVKLIFMDNFVYADHQYQISPEVQLALDTKTSNWPATKDNMYEGVTVPLKNRIEEPLPMTPVVV